MKTSIFNVLIFILLMGFSFQAVSQPGGKRMKERLKTMKKVKLLDVLDLEEDEEMQFLLKYNAIEDKFEDALDNFNDKEKALEKALRSDDENQINLASEEFLKAREAMVTIDKEKTEMARTNLNTQQFAKFLIFEKRFKQEITKHLIRNRKKPRY